MVDSLADLEQRRTELLQAFSELQDLRPGCISGILRRCGKPTCHCAQPDDPGHGPTLRMTYKRDGKTISEALPSPAAVRKAEREINEFRKYEALSRSFVETNVKICQRRPLEEAGSPAQEKKRRRPSSRRSRGK
ncbi:MAG: hypothetical protein JOZ22_22585 [Acidobacteriia bacterium]|nr:hypothetical protein [Terriglobia bacterium]MBV9406638.1 hypothetical protein [Acidobacteriaceae bacterium]